MNLIIAFGIIIVIAVSVPVITICLSAVLGPKKHSTIKMEPYECGVPQARQLGKSGMSAKFFIVALLFLVFDIEIVFLFPWAVVYRSLGLAGLVEMGIFIVILAAGLIYAVKRGALKWA